MKYDEFRPRRLQRPGVLQAPEALDRFTGRNKSQKPRSVKPTGEFLLYTDMRAIDRMDRDRSCCSNSHSPESHRHHSSFIGERSIYDGSRTRAGAFGEKELIDKFGRRLNNNISRTLVKHHKPFK